jgi:hypothetical protein
MNHQSEPKPYIMPIEELTELLDRNADDVEPIPLRLKRARHRRHVEAPPDQERRKP